VARKGRARLRTLVDVVAARYPELDAVAAITGGLVVVDGRPLTNPASLVQVDASVAIRAPETVLRGEPKLEAALAVFAVRVRGRVALDLGASAGGFTRVLLRAGAARVYAVDAGFGQLLGSLRADPRVVNLERTNLAALSEKLVPEPVDLVSADLSYVSLADAVPQLDGRIALARGAELVALVKPQFELGLPRPPASAAVLAEALEHAVAGVRAAGWTVLATATSPVRGTRGSTELLMHAVRVD
jgi:23S rRNA (cytidine1920-2'-O)/16S rRNA (cytidine1409-2'-O)-methyltransferase